MNHYAYWSHQPSGEVYAVMADSEYRITGAAGPLRWRQWRDKDNAPLYTALSEFDYDPELGQELGDAPNGQYRLVGEWHPGPEPKKENVKRNVVKLTIANGSGKLYEVYERDQDGMWGDGIGDAVGSDRTMLSHLQTDIDIIVKEAWQKAQEPCHVCLGRGYIARWHDGLDKWDSVACPEGCAPREPRP